MDARAPDRFFRISASPVIPVFSNVPTTFPELPVFSSVAHEILPGVITSSYRP